MNEVDQGWLVYHSVRDDAVGRIAVDTEVEAPVAGLPFLTRVSMPHRGAEGYAFTVEDGDALDALTAGVEGAPVSLLSRLAGEGPTRSTLVGRVTRSGVCHVYFYGERSLPKRQLVALERRVPGREFDVADRLDPEWSFYRNQLHPRAALPALLASHAQLEVRRAHGDRLDAVRDVHHTLFFPSDSARQAFLAACGQESGVRLFEAGAEHSGRPFGVELTRTHALGPVTTDCHLVFLSSHAARHGGIYDGWGALEQP